MVFKAHHRSITRQDIELEDLENAPASIASIENDTLEANVGSTPLTAKQKRNIYFLILLCKSILIFFNHHSLIVIVWIVDLFTHMCVHLLY